MSAWTIEQDAADQLTGVSVEGRAAGRQVFSYDLAGNRLTAQSGNATSTTAYNALNQITGISGGGRLRFSGTTSEAANVSVQGRTARMLDATTFTADAEVVPGVNTIPVVATDGNGNRRTNHYQVTVPVGATRAFVYDVNGNLLDDGERTYQWDAKNRLIEAKRGADTWQWSYNAFDQRVSETKNGVVTKRWVWAGGNQPAEERDAAGNVTRRFYPQGEQAGATKFYYTKDHLGSIREVMGANGTVVSSSRYDAWGVRTTHGVQDAASFGFTGHLEHKELGLVFTLYRAYDPATGRWQSRDPIGESGGINLYGYVGNDPVSLIDPLGLNPGDFINDASGDPNPFHIHDEAMDLEKKHMPSGHGAHGGGFAHCVANCLMKRRIGAPAAFIIRKLWDKDETCPSDIAANKKGADMADKPGSCVSNCLSAYPPQ
jgi:RHS repeat-associated protein